MRAVSICVHRSCTPTYVDGTLVHEGDNIRYRQAPGGLLPASRAWTDGTASRLDREPDDPHLYLKDEAGRFYYLIGHEIERRA